MAADARHLLAEMEVLVMRTYDEFEQAHERVAAR
jgi:hypothetical protein